MRGVALIVGFAAGGCSFAFTSSPRTPSRGELPACTTSHATVIVDVIGATPAYAIAAVMTVAEIEGGSFGDTPGLALKIGIPALVVGLAYTAAALYGSSNVGACNDALDEHLEALAHAADAGDCAPIVATIKHYAHSDVAMALALRSSPLFAACFN